MRTLAMRAFCTLTIVALMGVGCGKDSTGPTEDPENEHWWDGFALSNINDARSIVEHNGAPVAVLAPGQTVARWDGASWVNLRETTTGFFEHPMLHQGDLVVARRIDHVDSLDAIETWNGTTWQESARFRGVAQSVIEYEGDLVFGGSFWDTGTSEWRVAARWNGTSLTPLGDDLTAGIPYLVVFEGKLIVNGTHFLDGSTWVPLPGGLVAPAYAEGMVVAGDALYGRVYEGGAVSIRRWDGETWTTIRENAWPLASYNGTLVVNGATSAEHSLARWDGTKWVSLGDGVTSGSGGSGGVADLYAIGNRLYVAGSFTHAGLKASGGVARWED